MRRVDVYLYKQKLSRDLDCAFVSGAHPIQLKWSDLYQGLSSC